MKLVDDFKSYIQHVTVMRITVFILSLLPIFYLFLLIKLYRVDVPFGDQWEFVPYIEKFLSGKLTFSKLMSQHNEHRLFFPRIIMLFLAVISKWRISYELLIILILAIGIFIIFYFQLKETISQTGNTGLIWSLPFISILLFSINQWENWIWGWQIQILLSVFCVIFGIFILCYRDFNWKKFTLAVLLGFVALYSFANGIVYWILGLLILALSSSFKNRKEKLLAISTWFILMILFFGFYLYDYKPPANHPSMFEFLKHIKLFFIYIFEYFGASISSHEHSFVIGIFSYILFITLIFIILRNKIKFRQLLPYLSISFYSIGTSMLSGIGRCVIGREQVMSTRYRTFSNLFWISIIILLFLLLEILIKSEKHKKSFYTLKHVIIVIILLTIMYGTLKKNIACTIEVYNWNKRLVKGRNELLKENPNPEILKSLYPPGAFGVKRQLKTLKKLKYSVFR